MRDSSPFLASDLEEFDARLLSRASRVVPMYDIARGDTAPGVIGLRHDVDDNQGSLVTAMHLAEWEFEHGYSSTYFLLHGSHYWGEEMLMAAERLEELGHEVGLHVNCIAEGLRTNRDPRAILREAIDELRTAVRVVGVVAHGDSLCHEAFFVNDEMFIESRRANCGAENRTITWGNASVKLHPVSRGDYGIEYDPNWLSRGDYLSDSGGRWSKPFDEVAERFPFDGQLHILMHPDWWQQAFTEVAV